MSVSIIVGDCRERMRELPDASVDSVVCDPPYHLIAGGFKLRTMTKNGDGSDRTKQPNYAKGGFMGQTWDGGDVAFQPETWAEVLRVLKPGGHLVAFSGTRTYHRMAVAIEDAGFEIRDQLAWVYGAGFPKSHNLDKKIHDDDRCSCVGSEALSERDLRLVRDPHVSAPVNTSDERREVLFEGLPEQGSPRSMLRSEPKEGEAAAPEPLLEGRSYAQATEGELQGRALCEGAGMGAADGAEGPLHHGASASDGPNVRLPDDASGSRQSQGPQPGEQRSEQSGIVADERGSQTGGAWPLCARCGKPDIPRGLGSALKPAWEPICLARKPLDGTLVQNCLAYGTGVLNIHGCRIEAAGRPLIDPIRSAPEGGIGFPVGSKQVGTTDLGRWPANIIHDGSEEVLAGFPETPGTGFRTGASKGRWEDPASPIVGSGKTNSKGTEYPGEAGSAARFFYCAKATGGERGEGNNHPTVKPVDLMRWLCRLVTPRGGTILDPFAGSGSTLIAADREQFSAIGIELSEEYAAIARRRLSVDRGPLFAEAAA